MKTEISKTLVLWRDSYDIRNKQFCVIAPDCKSFFPVWDKRLEVKEDTVEIEYGEGDRFLFFPASVRNRPEYKSEYRYSCAEYCDEVMEMLDVNFYPSKDKAEKDAKAMKSAFETEMGKTTKIYVPQTFMDETVSLLYDRVTVPKTKGDVEYTFDIEKTAVEKMRDRYEISLPKDGLKRIYCDGAPYSSYASAEELDKIFKREFRNIKSDDDKGGKR